MGKRNVLGKGLGALIRDVEKREEGYRFVPVDRIVINKFQPRKVFDEGKLRGLCESIKGKGVIEPLLIRRGEDDGYELVAGERRWRAAKLAGLKEVPVVLLDISSKESLEIAIIENIQREDLNPIEEAEAYKRLMKGFFLSQEEVAKRLGRERATVANSLRLLKLPAEIVEMVAGGSITKGHAKVVLSLDNSLQQKELCKAIIKQGLSVRASELLVKKIKVKEVKEVKEKNPVRRDPDVALLETELKRIFGTKVSLKLGNEKGKIEIEFYSEDDMGRVIDMLRSLR